jgi:hypothetical protein
MQVSTISKRGEIETTSPSQSACAIESGRLPKCLSFSIDQVKSCTAHCYAAATGVKKPRNSPSPAKVWFSYRRLLLPCKPLTRPRYVQASLGKHSKSDSRSESPPTQVLLWYLISLSPLPTFPPAHQRPVAINCTRLRRASLLPSILTKPPFFLSQSFLYPFVGWMLFFCSVQQLSIWCPKPEVCLRTCGIPSVPRSLGTAFTRGATEIPEVD